MKSQSLEQQEAIRELKKLLKPGDTVYTILRHVSRSGMYRVIDLVIIKKAKHNGKFYPRNIGYLASQATGDKIDRNHNGIGVGGAGMDMGFHLVYNLGRELYPKGFKHNANTHRRNGSTEPRDKDGGYAFNQEWL
jgi:hypothetical protein